MIHYHFRESFWIPNFLCEFISNFISFSRIYNSIHYLFREFTSDLLFFAHVQEIWIHNLLYKSLSSHYVFNEFRIKYFFREFIFNSQYNSKILFEFTIFFLNSIPIHYLFLRFHFEFTICFATSLLIHFKFTIIFANAHWIQYFFAYFISNSLSCSWINFFPRESTVNSL